MITLRYSISFLQFGIQYKNRATPYATTKNIFMISLALCQHIHQCKPSNSVRHPILDTDCIIINSNITTIQININHKGEIHVQYYFDNVLWLIILLLRTNDTKTLQFYFYFTITTGHISIEDSMIPVKFFDFFKAALPTAILYLSPSLSWSKGNLIFNTDYVSCHIPKDSLATKTNLWPLTAVSTWKINRSLNNELIFWKNILLHIYYTT